jgi:hypothetical protein
MTTTTIGGPTSPTVKDRSYTVKRKQPSAETRRACDECVADLLERGLEDEADRAALHKLNFGPTIGQVTAVTQTVPGVGRVDSVLCNDLHMRVHGLI